MSKKIFAIVLALVLALGMVGSALASTAVRLKIDNRDQVYFEFIPETTDLFENFKNLMPGDTVKQEIEVHNWAGHIVRIWLRADPVSEQDFDFLNQLKLTVTASNSEIFEATAGVQDGLAPTEKHPYGVVLGTFKHGGNVNLEATIEVPIELDNQYMGRKGIVPWTFTIEQVEVDDTPQTGDDFSLWVWIAVAAVLVMGIVVLLIKQRKKRTEN